ncbi:hypothetical protein EIP86_007115 [Pleurotus ostreatoroseus]|nr:hypothetical protein EIP86_007115 [Pleurotus ostreatoroseus]
MPAGKRRAEDDCEESREPKRGKGAPPAGTIDFKTWSKPATMTFLAFMKDALDAIRQADKTRLEADQAEIEKLKLQKEVELAEIEKLKLQKEVEEARARSVSNEGSVTVPQIDYDGIQWDPSVFPSLNTW